MDALNMIMENYGSERITRVFKSYWLILLLIKQVMFTLFMVEPLPEQLPVENTQIIEKEILMNQTVDENFKGLNFFRVLLTLAQLESAETMEIDKSIPNPNPPIN